MRVTWSSRTRARFHAHARADETALARCFDAACSRALPSQVDAQGWTACAADAVEDIKVHRVTGESSAAAATTPMSEALTSFMRRAMARRLDLDASSCASEVRAQRFECERHDGWRWTRDMTVVQGGDQAAAIPAGGRAVGDGRWRART